MSFVAELKRRNVIRVAGLYLVGAWFIVQVTSTVLPMFDAPPWLPRSIASLGHLDEAEQAIRKAIELASASGIFDASLVVIDVHRGDAKTALADAERALPGIWQDYALAMARQIGNDRMAADAALKLIVDKYADGMAFQIAEVYALRREPDKIFEWLDRAWANRDPGLQYFFVNPVLLRYRDDPRFATFCKKVGLPSTTTAKALP